MPKVKTLKQKLAGASKATSNGKPRAPLWEGPESDGPNGGVTQSAIGQFLICRERFRLKMIEGWREADQFQHRTSYGDMWHVCEEALAGDGGGNILPRVETWLVPLKDHCTELCRRYPMAQEQVVHWMQVCKAQFPEYVRYWQQHPATEPSQPIAQEMLFNVPYKLPSGRTVRLRGKMDGVNLVGKGKAAGIYLMEHKTKGDIDEQQMRRQLNFDLQTMTYLVVLTELQTQPGQYRLGGEGIPRGVPILGVQYNVIRRPLSGGTGTIRRHKATKNQPEETYEAFYRRLVDDYIAKEPEKWFMRWTVLISKQDIERFKRECLDPILEQLCDWYSWITGEFNQKNLFDCDGDVEGNRGANHHFRMPYGVYSPLLDGGATSLDELLETGSELGLQRVNKLFKELQ